MHEWLASAFGAIIVFAKGTQVATQQRIFVCFASLAKKQTLPGLRSPMIFNKIDRAFFKMTWYSSTETIYLVLKTGFMVFVGITVAMKRLYRPFCMYLSWSAALRLFLSKASQCSSTVSCGFLLVRCEACVRGTWDYPRQRPKRWQRTDLYEVYDTRRAGVWAKLGFTKFWSTCGSQKSGICMSTTT
jgi:hypothetical protein